MKTRYLLRSIKDNVNTYQIYIALYQGDEWQSIYTKQRIHIDEWEKSTRMPKDHTGEVFKEIEKVKRLVEKAYKKLDYEDSPITPYTVKEAYKELINEKNKAQESKEKIAKAGQKSIYNLAINFYENLPAEIEGSTKKTITISIKQFLAYLEKAGKRSLGKADLSEDIITKYGEYLLTKMQGTGGVKRGATNKKGLANSTYNKRLKHLRQFLKSIDIHLPVKLRKVKKRAILALDVNELRALENVDVTTHKDKLSHEYFQRAKDLFLLGCYTSLRISDIKRLNPTNTSGGFINLTTQKNNKVIRIPIIPLAKVILEKYHYRAPKISDQEANRSIKQVCKLAGIDSTIQWNYSRGGKELTKDVPKYELITIHVSGKTFITNAKELWKLEPTEVAAITGKDFKTMLNHYFNQPVESAITKMMKSSGFMKITA